MNEFGVHEASFADVMHRRHTNEGLLANLNALKAQGIGSCVQQ